LETFRGSVRVGTFFVMCVCLCSAGTGEQEPQPAASSFTQPPEQALASWLDLLWELPILHFLAPLFQPAPEILPTPSTPEVAATAEPPQTFETCSVAPLDPIEDPAAKQLEASVGFDGVVDVSEMVPAAARALDRFQSKVAGVGGTIILKSAYRPAAYQRHLQNVWYKWMKELRDNWGSACQSLRTQVRDEFTRHHLIETQHPVAVSDHTRGLAFDATVELPSHARLSRRRITLDSLARLAGLLRPAIAADPVHFKYVGGTGFRPAGRQRNT
jgi:hypothetical protein